MCRILLSVLLLGWTWGLHAVPLATEPLYTTQENFDLGRFLGTWYDLAVATKCSHMQHRRGDAAIGKLVLQRGTGQKLKMTRTMLKQSSCVEITGEYEQTSTAGRFFYHVAKWNADVDAYVVHTNYNEYAILIMNKKKPTGESVSVKLYSRSKDIRPTILEDFKTLARQQGISDEFVIIKQNKGDCVPGEQVVAPSTQPELPRMRRAVLPTLPSVDIEGSGDDAPFFNGTEACTAAPDTGPCFGMKQRYFYNATSMTCQIFNYGGCLGNQNNFEKERDCLQGCRTEAVCRLPMVAEPCTDPSSTWAFDFTVGLCVPYKKGFCQTNGNKFYSKAECEEYCGVVKDDGDLLNAN
ncbi:protein AMBP-like [Periophthalmus magnuspinnatus]|uniref:protein AMBP-like n=1 Tax=Periophthalmus magnuspinnatus TaxID=409849 RepID=UPI00145BDA10|nr:protein AMBP-like [Periophthalmus magnuspinnatus]